MTNNWLPIDSAPRDGTEVFLFNSNWDVAPIAFLDWVEGPDEDGSGCFCLWHLKTDNFGAMGDGLLWPKEDLMPTHWQPVPEPPKP